MISGPGKGGVKSRILALQLKRLGDLVLTLPAIRSLTQSGADVTLVTEAPFQEILDGVEGGPAGARLHPHGELASLQFGFDLRRERFDAAIDFEGSARSARLLLQSGAPIRIGWAKRLRRLACTDAVPIPPRAPAMHTADQKLLLVRRLGIAAGDSAVSLVVTQAERGAAASRLEHEAQLPAGIRWLAAMPASRRGYKQLPPSLFAAILERFRPRAGEIVVLLGGPGEKEQLSAVCRLVATPPPIVLAGSIRELMALLALAGAVIGPDGGARHLAEGLDRPTLPLFGPQDPAVWTRLSPRHRAIRARRVDCRVRCSRGNQPCACLAALDPDAVAGELNSLWESEAAQAP